MKFLVLALCVCAVHSATVPFGGGKPYARAQASVQAPVAPQSAPVARSNVGQTSDVEAAVLRSDSDVKPDGFNYAYETSNGIVAESSGSVKNVDNLDVINVQGSYSYRTPEGVNVAIQYVADENGYQPQGELLPTSPPIPEAILRSLEYIRSRPQFVEAERPSAVANAVVRRV